MSSFYPGTLRMSKYYLHAVPAQRYINRLTIVSGKESQGPALRAARPHLDRDVQTSYTRLACPNNKRARNLEGGGDRAKYAMQS